MSVRDHPGWPATLRRGRVVLRPLRMRDASIWSRLRMENRDWLAPWEPTSSQSWEERHSVTAYISMLSRLRQQARRGVTMPFAVLYDEQLVGQITVANIVRGSMRSAQIGYWVSQGYAGRGITPVAVALVTDHCFRAVRLHRIQVDIRPENAASRRVVEKLRFREEAHFVRYLDIDGAYRDHIGYALTAEECRGGLIRRLPLGAGE